MRTDFLQGRSRGFTLMETLIALSIFSVAVVALAEAIQRAAQAADLIRQEVVIQDRMTALTSETMRLIALHVAGQRPQVPEPVEENGVTYRVAVREINNLQNKDKMAVEGLWEITTTADWMEGRMEQHLQDVAWVFPPLLPTLQ